MTGEQRQILFERRKKDTEEQDRQKKCRKKNKFDVLLVVTLADVGSGLVVVRADFHDDTVISQPSPGRKTAFPFVRSDTVGHNNATKMSY